MGCCASTGDRVQPMDETDAQLHNISRDSDYQGPVKKRGCTDIFFLLIFIAFLVGLGYLVIYSIYKGDIYRVLNGYDSYGNVCGKANKLPEEYKCLELDQTNKKYLLLEGPTYSGSRRRCVEKCSDDYKEIVNRCIPVKEAQFINKYATAPETTQFFQTLSEDLEQCRMKILYLFLIALGFSVLIMILFRFFVGIVVWSVLVAVVVVGIIGTVYLWIVWVGETRKPKEDTTSGTQSKMAPAYLAFAIITTIVTVILTLVIIAMRKRIKLVIQLFKEAGKSISSMPCLLIQPFLTFLMIGVAVAVWLFCFAWIESAGLLVVENAPTFQTDCKLDGTTKAYYKQDTTIKVAEWYNIFALLWFVNFFIGCQHMVIAGAVSAWFFTRDKSSLGFPIVRAYGNVVRYHLGSIALGSFLIALVQMVRLVLKFIESLVKGKDNGVSRCFFRVCQCCLYCYEKFLQYLTRNAYIEIAMFGYNFCKAGREAFQLIAANILRLGAINCLGDLVLILGKAVVVAATVLIGVAMFQKEENLHYEWILLVLVGVIAFLISHGFLTVFEMAIDTIFLCFCEDCNMNDGINRPYFMSRGLMVFVQNSKKALSNRESPARTSEAWSSSSRQLTK
ncbi:choline transporter-like protein 1 [Anabrus simplex]|uniref:choline transporter-like protein 1 n=1 Tax=Anabrus simplex TaxID=316456 RepID=UPI0035A35315